MSFSRELLNFEGHNIYKSINLFSYMYIQRKTYRDFLFQRDSNVCMSPYVYIHTSFFIYAFTKRDQSDLFQRASDF